MVSTPLGQLSEVERENPLNGGNATRVYSPLVHRFYMKSFSGESSLSITLEVLRLVLK